MYELILFWLLLINLQPFFKDNLQLKRSVQTLFYKDKVRLRLKRSVEIALYKEMKLLMVGKEYEDSQNNKKDPKGP